MPQPSLAISRFQPYFADRERAHDVLMLGDTDIAVANVRSALFYLGHVPTEDTEETFDSKLAEAVRAYQQKSGHAVADGKVGPNTRRRLVTDLLQNHDQKVFGRMRKRPEAEVPTVFISYAHEDSEKVDKLDQWLTDRNVRVLRDIDLFRAGHTVEENIRSAVARADKILAIYSNHSRSKDWPRVELNLGEELERVIDDRVLIYLRLDDCALPPHDPNRLAIDAAGRPLNDVGHEILYALMGTARPPRPRTPYDGDAPL